jgi:conjugative relaxase-like TrwC/TraI family protein
LLALQQPGQKRAWFVIDELASLQRLPQFHTALTKGRKSNNPIIFGYQGKAQLEVIYGHLAEVMLSQPSTKFVLKTAEPKAAKWASELIGEIEIERVRETVADGMRAGKSFMMDRQIEPLVMSSEIEGLDDLHSFVKLGNYVSRFSFPPMQMRKIAEALLPRVVPESDLWFDPLHPKTSESDETEAQPTLATKERDVLALAPRKGQPTPSALRSIQTVAHSTTITATSCRCPMLRISRDPLSSSQAKTYHKMDYTSEAQSYYKQNGAVQGQWQGQLAEKYGLKGIVAPEEFSLLADGKHPQTDDQLVKHRNGQEYTNADGTTTKPVEHRAGWDATFSPAKSVSLTALVGGDERVRDAHNAAVTTALAELVRFTQARIGSNHPAETTGKFVAATFEHDTARPVDGYAAPQLHTHAVIFNVTERGNGTTRALQSKSFYDSQSYVTAVYQSELTHRLSRLGYEFETGRSGVPEIKGYSEEYLAASSLRSEQIRLHLEKSGQSGPAAAQIAALATRDSKQTLSREEVLTAHKELAAEYGNQANRVIAEARARTRNQEQLPNGAAAARQAVTYTRASNYEREAVVDERILMRDALRRGMGEATFAQVRAEFEARTERGEFRQLTGSKHATSRSFTTPETIAHERANVAHVLSGRNAFQPIATEEKAKEQAASRSFLNKAQRTVILEVLTSRDRVHGLQGLAGTGKTTTLEAIREGAEKNGYVVEGFAPTSRAAGQLREAGVSATTLQSFLVRGGRGQTTGDPNSRHLYLLDESSLASTQQMKGFLDKIQPQDRVLVIGDTQQHQGVEAGKPFQQMQDGGMKTAQLDQIMRQKDPELLKAVEHLAKNETAAGVKMLAEQGRITELSNTQERIAAIAKDYAAKPETPSSCRPITAAASRSTKPCGPSCRPKRHWPPRA